MEPPGGEFVHVLSISGNHWIMISTLGCVLGLMNVYHGLHFKLSSTTKKPVSELLMIRNKPIAVTYNSVQWQIGGSHCGLFTVAIATSQCEVMTQLPFVMTSHKCATTCCPVLLKEKSPHFLSDLLTF